MINYGTLSEDDYPEVFRTMVEAFSDYFVKMKMDFEAYRKTLALEGVNFEHSVGAFDGEKLVGATLNAVGYWNGVSAVHDSGTGVIPRYRRHGVSRGMFEFIIPRLREDGYKRYSLEVIVENDAAFKLYQGLGFEVSREFLIFENRNALESGALDEGIEVKEIAYPDWEQLRELWSNEPSWQNSLDCLKRAKIINFKSVVLGLFVNEQLAG